MNKPDTSKIYRYRELDPSSKILKASGKNRHFNKELLFDFFNYCSGKWSGTEDEKIMLINRMQLRSGQEPVSVVYKTSLGEIRFSTDSDRAYTCVMFADEKT